VEVELRSRANELWTDYSSKVDFGGSWRFITVWDFYFALDIIKHLSSVQ
jgi:hypothetical protein